MSDPMLAPVPDWVPSEAARYLAHTEGGLPIRELARHAGCHASTVLRQIRRVENRRDDRLVDAALRHLGRQWFAPAKDSSDKEHAPMNAITPLSDLPPDDETLRREALCLLRRLNEPGAVLAVASGLDKAVVVRDGAPQGGVTSVMSQTMAQALALKGWITCTATGRVSRYVISMSGRAELARLLAESERRAMRRGMAEAASLFHAADAAEQDETDEDETARRRLRYGPAESPLAVLARRKDRDGRPFLDDDLVQAGERLREDFELAQLSPRSTRCWDSYLTGSERGGGAEDSTRDRVPADARERVAVALRALGPGLGDVALRCCCYLEGLETAERRMGWSARSGKIVLRIALQRLKAHYDRQGPEQRLIG